MAVHTDTANLQIYKPKGIPTLEGGTETFLKNELRKISDAVSGLVAACKAMEARMNSAGLA